MLVPANVELRGGRWVPLITTVRIIGINLTGATFKMQVRLYPDAPGSPLYEGLTVTSATAEGVRLVYGGSATVSAHIAAGRLTEIPDGMLGTDSLNLTILGIRVNETTMEGFPFPDERGNDLELAWDLHVTVTDKQKYMGGKFVVEAGVTQ